MSRRDVRAWDAPVVSALNEVEKLPGLEPDHVEWDNFRFYGTGAGLRMDRATIYAYPATPGRSGHVRFTATGDELAITDQEHRTLTANDVARMLSVPTESAAQAMAALEAALRHSLAAYNAAHAPQVRSTTANAQRRLAAPHSGPVAAPNDQALRSLGL